MRQTHRPDRTSSDAEFLTPPGTEDRFFVSHVATSGLLCSEHLAVARWTCVNQGDRWLLSGPAPSRRIPRATRRSPVILSSVRSRGAGEAPRDQHQAGTGGVCRKPWIRDPRRARRSGVTRR